jgi:6-phosphogluconate dehydrogenase
MVHNGIEYGDMQLIGEGYHLMRVGLGLDADAMQRAFAEWNRGELDSYLIEITADILGHREAGAPTLEQILDVAGQKGTGKWTVVSAAELGAPITLIGEAVFARYLSARKQERIAASRLLAGPTGRLPDVSPDFIDQLRQALYAAKIVSYAQGFTLLQAAARQHDWRLNYGEIALLWRGGCIIRSRFLQRIETAFVRDPELPSLLVDEFFRRELERSQAAWRNVVATAVGGGLPVPALSAALAYYDGYRSGRLPANLLQAQRDYFGAHTYERVDRPRGEFFHTNWTGRGGDAASTEYSG